MFHGRFKDMLKVGGENVAGRGNRDLRSARHPAVKLAQVVGIPDPKYAEVPAAFVELNPGAAATEAEAAVLPSARLEVASFKVPRVVPRFVQEWPMSSSKIQKFRLRRASADGTGAGLRHGRAAPAAALQPDPPEWVRGPRSGSRRGALVRQLMGSVRSMRSSTSPSARCIFAANRWCSTCRSPLHNGAKYKSS